MVRKKKNKDIEEAEFTETTDEEEDFNFGEPEDDEEIGYGNEDDDSEEGDGTYNNAMQIGGDIHKQSQILTKFPQLAKEVKYSFFSSVDQKTFLMRSKTYQSLNYMKLIYNLSYLENNNVRELRKMLYKVRTKEDFKIYLEATGNSHLWYNIKNLSEKNISDDVIDLPKEYKGIKKFLIKLLPKKKKINKFLVDINKKNGSITFDDLRQQLIETDKDGIIENIYNIDTQVSEVYQYYKDGNVKIEPVDELGLLNDIYSITEASKARGGNERKSMNTTISETKEHNERDEQNESGENILVGTMKRFLYKNQKRNNEE